MTKYVWHGMVAAVFHIRSPWRRLCGFEAGLRGGVLVLGECETCMLALLRTRVWQMMRETDSGTDTVVPDGMKSSKYHYCHLEGACEDIS